jgi:hypothetical protein
MCLGFRDVSGPVYCGLREVSGLTAAAAAAEAEDGARCRVDIAGALVSPLISAPKLELPLRGLPILNSRLLLLLLALAHQSESVWAHSPNCACAQIVGDGLGTKAKGPYSAYSAYSGRKSAGSNSGQLIACLLYTSPEPEEGHAGMKPVLRS